MRIDHLLAVHLDSLKGYPEVDVPKPEVPSGDDATDKLDSWGDALGSMDSSWLAIILVLIVAAIITKMLKNPLVKGIVGGVILLAILLVVFS